MNDSMPQSCDVSALVNKMDQEFNLPDGSVPFLTEWHQCVSDLAKTLTPGELGDAKASLLRQIDKNETKFTGWDLEIHDLPSSKNPEPEDEFSLVWLGQRI